MPGDLPSLAALHDAVGTKGSNDRTLTRVMPPAHASSQEESGYENSDIKREAEQPSNTLLSSCAVQ